MSFLIASIDNIFTRGAYRIRQDGQFVTDDRKAPEELVKCYPYVELAAAFKQTSSPACCSCYNIDNFQYPWVRFSNKQVRDESGLSVMVSWLHYELDFVKRADGQKQFWPGVYEKDGFWFADSNAKSTYAAVVAALGADRLHHYMSRSGVHVLFPIKPIPIDSFLGYGHRYLAEHVEPRMTAVRKIAPLNLDSTCVEPSRLHYLPRIRKPKQGHLFLPLQIQAEIQQCDLPAPNWLQSSSQFSTELVVDMRLSNRDMKEARVFAERWLGTHIKWLQTALPGTGRNARLYAMGGDIRQFQSCGIYSATEARSLLESAISLGNNALISAVHNAEGAVHNGYSAGSMDSVAALHEHLRRVKRNSDVVEQLTRLLGGK